MENNRECLFMLFVTAWHFPPSPFAVPAYFTFFFFNDPAPTEISPFPLPDALPIYRLARAPVLVEDLRAIGRRNRTHTPPPLIWTLTAKPARTGSLTIPLVGTPGQSATAAANPRDRRPDLARTGCAAYTVPTQ